ncbi:hypothetical protein DNH61_06430 [Paenibacillus sambharensis]|uniref:Alpha/beta hydrolase n=1 Tax=Paenibacillus sambharensis TaxID=1803190 RepID=A0A2W1LFK6_9BACL|nr:alpha/beta hydrolase family protein [Paenibacillus sambharensis]PZD96830.1 hypothetical protein DNH61_06430 [Paenibacillus sambharensis]
MTEERLVEIFDQGWLAGVLHLPEQSTWPCPLVIYCPGKNGERYEVHRLAIKFARMLAGMGIAFLRFDYYGLGLSDGKYHHMTTSTKVSNIIAAHRYAATLRAVDKSRMAYLGFSDGARIALMASQRTTVKDLVLWSPLFCEIGGNFPNKKHPRFTRHSRDRDSLVMPWAGLWVGMEFYRDLQSIDINRELSDFQGRSIMVYGNDDLLIKEEMEQLATDRYAVYRGDGRNTVCRVDKAGHLFTSVPLERELMKLSSDWLVRLWDR